LRSFDDKRVLITGAGRGLGALLAERFAEDGARLLLVDLDRAGLEETARSLKARGTEVVTAVEDVTADGAPEKIAALARSSFGGLDVLVNNAGVVFGGALEDVPAEKHKLTYLVNTVAPALLTRACLPMLLAEREAMIVGLSSATGLIGFPFGATYSSSKWGMTGFCESLRQELRERGQSSVKVKIVCPSYINTGMFQGVKAPRLLPILEPAPLARSIHRFLKKPCRTYYYAPFFMNFVPLLKGIAPLWAQDLLLRWMRVQEGMKTWKGR
jgi:NAD(P)-dependent dehydrogenase (short-subunit alcohol dehydrogenase family)